MFSTASASSTHGMRSAGSGPSLRELLAAGRLGDLADAIEGAEGVPLADVALMPPIPDPEKILCIGLNYRSHAEETKQPIPDVPTVFAKFRNALAAPGATVELPRASEKVDYEAEVCIVIGTRLKEVDDEAALAGDRRLHPAQRSLGTRPAARNDAVDLGQVVRRRCAVRARDRHSRRSSLT